MTVFSTLDCNTGEILGYICFTLCIKKQPYVLIKYILMYGSQ